MLLSPSNTAVKNSENGVTIYFWTATNPTNVSIMGRVRVAISRYWFNRFWKGLQFWKLIQGLHFAFCNLLDIFAPCPENGAQVGLPSSTRYTNGWHWFSRKQLMLVSKFNRTYSSIVFTCWPEMTSWTTSGRKQIVQACKCWVKFWWRFLDKGSTDSEKV